MATQTVNIADKTTLDEVKTIVTRSEGKIEDKGGCRVYNGNFQVWDVDNETWTTVEIGGGSSPSGSFVRLDDITIISPINSVRGAAFKWEDPGDVYIEGGWFAEWEGTLLVRKYGETPSGPADGTVILDSKIRDQYKTNYFYDTTGETGVTYFYRFFPYSKSGVYTNGSVFQKGKVIVSWSDDYSDEEIEDAIKASDEGIVDLYADLGWRAGDSRTIRRNIASFDTTNTEMNCPYNSYRIGMSQWSNGSIQAYTGDAKAILYQYNPISRLLRYERKKKDGTYTKKPNFLVSTNKPIVMCSNRTQVNPLTNNYYNPAGKTAGSINLTMTSFKYFEVLSQDSLVLNLMLDMFFGEFYMRIAKPIDGFVLNLFRNITNGQDYSYYVKPDFKDETTADSYYSSFTSYGKTIPANTFKLKDIFFKFDKLSSIELIGRQTSSSKFPERITSVTRGVFDGLGNAGITYDGSSYPYVHSGDNTAVRYQASGYGKTLISCFQNSPSEWSPYNRTSPLSMVTEYIGNEIDNKVFGNDWAIGYHTSEENGGCGQTEMRLNAKTQSAVNTIQIDSSYDTTSASATNFNKAPKENMYYFLI